MSRRRDPSIRRVRVRRSRRRSHAALLRRFRDPRGAARRGCFAGARSAGPAWWGQWFRKRKLASPESTRGYVGVQVLSVRAEYLAALSQLNFHLDAPKALLERFRSISLVRFVASSRPRRNSVVSKSVSQKGHFRLSALSHLTVSLIRSCDARIKRRRPS